MKREEGFISIKGRKIEFCYYIGLRSEATPIVMLHEGLGSVSTWHKFPSELSKLTGLGVVVYSRYGYGRSTVRQEDFDIDYMHRAALDELPEFLKYFGIKKPVLFGHSDGASIALIFAGAYPLEVHAVIGEAPHVFTERVSVDQIAATAKLYETSDDLKIKLSRHHLNADASFYGWNQVWQIPEFMSWNIEEYIQNICCPLLVIQGKDDEYGTEQQIDRIENSGHGRIVKLILDDCGHAPHRDQKKLVLQATANFIDSL